MTTVKTNKLISLIAILMLSACNSEDEGSKNKAQDAEKKADASPGVVRSQGSDAAAVASTVAVSSEATPSSSSSSVSSNVLMQLGFDGSISDASGRQNFVDFGSVSNVSSFKAGTASRQFTAASSQYIKTPHNSGFNFSTQDFEITFWIKTTMSGVGYVFGQYNAACQPSSNTIAFNIGGSGGAGGPGKGQLIIMDGATNRAIHTINTINDNTWHYIRISRVNTDVTLYLDGVVQNTLTAVGAIPNALNDFAIGRPGECVSSYFDGALDEFKITVQ